MPTPLIIIVGADKGGVGKTQVTRALCDYLETPAFNDMPRPRARVLDSQAPKGDLARFYVPDAEIINIKSVQDQMKVFDALAGVTIVDLAAGELGYTIRALDEVRLLDDVRAGILRVALLHVLGPSISSISEIGDAVAALGTTAKHYIVKNAINETTYFEWDQDSRYAQSLRALEGVTISVPHLETTANEAVQKFAGDVEATATAAGGKTPGLSFIQFAAGDSSRTLRGHVARWLDRTWSSFDRVGLGELIKASSR